MEIKKLIDEVKRENGNNSFTNKDLLFYLVGRVDKLDNKLDKFITHTDDKLDSKMDKKSFKTMCTVIMSVLIAIIGGIIKVIYDLVKTH